MRERSDRVSKAGQTRRYFQVLWLLAWKRVEELTENDQKWNLYVEQASWESHPSPDLQKAQQALVWLWGRWEAFIMTQAWTFHLPSWGGVLCFKAPKSHLILRVELEGPWVLCRCMRQKATPQPLMCRSSQACKEAQPSCGHMFEYLQRWNVFTAIH